MECFQTLWILGIIFCESCGCQGISYPIALHILNRFPKQLISLLPHFIYFHGYKQSRETTFFQILFVLEIWFESLDDLAQCHECFKLLIQIYLFLSLDILINGLSPPLSEPCPFCYFVYFIIHLFILSLKSIQMYLSSSITHLFALHWNLTFFEAFDDIFLQLLVFTLFGNFKLL